MADLERVTAEAERVEPTLETERVKPTEPSQEPTVGITETEEFRQELRKALGKSTESINRQLSLSQAETRKSRADVEMHKAQIAARDAQLQGLKREVEEALVDDPEKRQAYISRIASLEREQKIADKDAKAEKKLYEAELKMWQAGMGLKAQELANEVSGLDPKWLIEGCSTEAEMEVKALRFKLTKEPEKQEPEKKQKFDSGISSGGGGMPELGKDKIRAGWDKIHK